MLSPHPPLFHPGPYVQAFPLYLEELVFSRSFWVLLVGWPWLKKSTKGSFWTWLLGSFIWHCLHVAVILSSATLRFRIFIYPPPPYQVWTSSPPPLHSPSQLVSEHAYSVTLENIERDLFISVDCCKNLGHFCLKSIEFEPPKDFLDLIRPFPPPLFLPRFINISLLTG